MKSIYTIILLSVLSFAQGIGGKGGVGGKAGIGGGVSGSGTPFALDGTKHGVTDNGASSSTTATVVLTSVTANDLIVCEISFGGTLTFTSVSDNVNAGNYSAAVAVHKNTTISQWEGIYFKSAVASGTTTITLTTTSGQFLAISCQAFVPGSLSTQTQDGSAVQQDLTTTANPTAAAGTTTPVGNNELIICTLLTNGNTPTAGTNYTLIDAATTTLSFPEYWTQTTATSTNCPYTMGSDSWTDQMAIIK